MSPSSENPKPKARYWESILPCVKLKVNNTEFSFSIPNDKAMWVADDVANREPEVYRWIDSCLDEKSLFIDVGANFGLFSLYAALKARCRVLAFEPHFASYYVLSRNIILNNLLIHFRIFQIKLLRISVNTYSTSPSCGYLVGGSPHA